MKLRSEVERTGCEVRFLCCVGASAQRAPPNVFKISLVTPAGDEKETRWLPENTPMDEIMDRVEQILGALNVPFKGIRVYRGQDLLVDENFEMR